MVTYPSKRNHVLCLLGYTRNTQPQYLFQLTLHYEGTFSIYLSAYNTILTLSSSTQLTPSHKYDCILFLVLLWFHLISHNLYSADLIRPVFSHFDIYNLCSVNAFGPLLIRVQLWTVYILFISLQRLYFQFPSIYMLLPFHADPLRISPDFLTHIWCHAMHIISLYVTDIKA